MKRILLASTCLLAVTTASTSAFAQDAATGQPGAADKEASAPAADASADAAASSQNSALGGDIVVTAQRRSESLQHAAVAVSAFSGDALKQAGITRPTELTSIVPALQVAPAAGPYNLFYLRGVGNFNGNALSDSAIAFNFDGVYIGRPSGSTGFFYDLDRVEVVKGPQGTLYGRNATGGAINVISHKPELDTFGASGSVEYGNYDQLRIDGMVNAPLGNSAAVRIAGVHVSHDGYMNDGTDDQNDWAGRVSLRVDPSSTVRINLVGDYFHQGGQGAGATPILAPNGEAAPSAFDPDDRIGFFSPDGQTFYTSQRAGTLGRNFYPFPAGFKQFQRNEAWGIAGNVDWDTPVGTFTIIPAHREISLDYMSYTPGFQVQEQGKTKQDSVEARLATPESNPLRAIVGAYYFNEKTYNPRDAYASNWNAQYDADLRQHTESEAIFGRLVWEVVPSVRLNVGARQTWESKTFTGTRVSLTLLCGSPPILDCPAAPPLPYGFIPPAAGVPLASVATPFLPFPTPIPPGVMPLGPAPYGGLVDPVGSPFLLQSAVVTDMDEARKFDKFTWRVGADWDVTSNNLLYASYETGFKSGGFFFSPLPTRSSYQPETIQAYTVGSKNRFFDNVLTLNAELFYWRYKNQQVSHLVTIANVPTFATENVGKATFKGFEVEARVAPTPTTTLTADVQYLDAKYNDFVYLQTNSVGAPDPTLFNGTGCPTTGFDAATGNSFIVDCGGQRPPFAPKWTLNLGAEQRLPVSFGEFVIDARTHYQTRSSVGLDFVPVETQNSYWLADAAVTFNAPNKKYFVGAFINNIFDVTIKSQMFPTPGTSFYSTTLRPPRTYGVRAGFNF